jgi:hypothetical protein
LDWRKHSYIQGREKLWIFSESAVAVGAQISDVSAKIAMRRMKKELTFKFFIR